MAPPTCDARQRPSWVVPTPLAPSTVADGGAHAPSPHLPRGRPRGALHCSTTALLATGRWQPARCLIRSVVVPSILACRSMPWRAHEIRFFFSPESERGGWELRRAPWPWRTSCSLAWVARPRSWVWRSCARPSRPRWTSSARASASSSSRRSVPLTPAPPPAPTPPPPLLSGAPRRCVRRTLRGRTHRPPRPAVHATDGLRRSAHPFPAHARAHTASCRYHQLSAVGYWKRPLYAHSPADHAPGQLGRASGALGTRGCCVRLPSAGFDT